MADEAHGVDFVKIAILLTKNRTKGGVTSLNPKYHYSSITLR